MTYDRYGSRAASELTREQTETMREALRRRKMTYKTLTERFGEGASIFDIMCEFDAGSLEVEGALRARIEALEAENERLRVIEAAAQRVMTDDCDAVIHPNCWAALRTALAPPKEG